MNTVEGMLSLIMFIFLSFAFLIFMADLKLVKKKKKLDGKSEFTFLY